jgi:hypothetical protein
VAGLPEPDPDLFLIVTIPAFKEPDLGKSLHALLACDPPGVKWEIIVNVNYPVTADPESVRISLSSLEVAEQISRNSNRPDVRILSILSDELPARHAGVGLARKIAMDQAIARFNRIGRPDGVIAGFDADSCCEAGYLKSIAGLYLHNKGVRTANVFFGHPIAELSDPHLRRSIAEYELYLRYMRLALRETGHPHDIHTVGSSFTVRAKTYVRVNGMGRDKAGEDFYFLHKCIQLGGFWEINETAVLPSARESDRVAFGTGATMQRQMKSDGELVVYNLDSFYPLKHFFSSVLIYRGIIAASGDLELAWADLPVCFRSFLKQADASASLVRIFRDSASPESFTKKFFSWFNVLMVLRCLNEMHREFYNKEPVGREASRLAMKIGIDETGSVIEMLTRYRNYERQRGNFRIS